MKMRKRDIREGMRFGKWTTLGDSEVGNDYVLCECDCGKQKEVRVDHLVRGGSTQCRSCSSKVHGKYGTRLYSIWWDARSRTTKPSSSVWDYYGGRGIEMCPEWRDDFNLFETWAIKSGYSDELTLDRRDVNGNYNPNNCRWVCRRVQTSNQRLNQRNKSGFVGVHLRGRRWTAFYSGTYLGTFDTPEEASVAYQEAKANDHELHELIAKADALAGYTGEANE